MPRFEQVRELVKLFKKYGIRCDVHDYVHNTVVIVHHPHAPVEWSFTISDRTLKWEYSSPYDHKMHTIDQSDVFIMCFTSISRSDGILNRTREQVARESAENARTQATIDRIVNKTKTLKNNERVKLYNPR